MPKPAPPQRKPIFGFGGDSDDEEDTNSEAKAVTELGGLSKKKAIPSHHGKKSKKPPQISPYGNLSSALESRKNQEAAEALDPSIYDYDGVYESLKPEKKVAQEDIDRRPKYMNDVIASAAVRKRDALIAEEKKIAREREAEGDEFADKEKFVTEAYRKQQEENRRLEEEERRKEEKEAEQNKGKGMTAFYKDLLNRDDRRHAEMMKDAEEQAKAGPKPDEEDLDQKEKTDTDVARELNAKGAHVAINEDGQVVDKRELLKGGLNLGTVKRPEPRKETSGFERRNDRDQSRGFVGAGGKNAMRARQSRMMEAQLEQTLKRSLQEEEEERQKVERAAKSRKTESEISSAKERYLARKRAAEEAKKNGVVS